MDVQGHMVQDMFNAGQLAEINDYCRCDVLDTYFVFLRTRVLVGELSLEQEHALIEEAKAWLTARAETSAAYRLYLDRWGDWHNPWARRVSGKGLCTVSEVVFLFRWVFPVFKEEV